MASITCKINITNKWRNTRFFLFTHVPTPIESTSEIYANVFQMSHMIEAKRDGSSTISFSIDNMFYAIYGTSTGDGLKTGIRISSYKEIKLGPSGSVVAITNDNGGIIWDEKAAQGKQSDEKGGFEFLTDENIPGDGNSNLYIGVGTTDPSHPEEVIPLQTYKAESSLSSKFYPKLTYYVATGDFVHGQLVDRTEVGKWVKIDFKGAKVPTANVILLENGSWADDNLQSKNNGVNIQSSA